MTCLKIIAEAKKTFNTLHMKKFNFLVKAKFSEHLSIKAPLAGFF